MTHVTVGRTVDTRSEEEEERIHIDLGDSQLNPDEARTLVERVEEQLALLDGGAVIPEMPATDEIDVDEHPPDEMTASPEYHTRQGEGGDRDGEEGDDGREGSEDTCPDCGEEFASARGVAIHRGKAHGDDADGDDDADGEEEHECPACGDVFDSARGMKVHHSREHDVPVDERSDDPAAAAEGSEGGPEPEGDEGEGEDDPGTAALRRRRDEGEETGREQKGDGDRADDDVRGGGRPSDAEYSCPVCGERFDDCGAMRLHRDDEHDEIEVFRVQREEVREDLPRNVSIADVEQSVAAHGTVYEVQQDLRVVPRDQLKLAIGKLQLTDALEEHSEIQSIHMIEDLHDELGIDEPVPEVPAADGGESA